MALVDYSAMEGQIKEAPEPKVLAKGSEVKARIIAIRDGVSEKNGVHWYSPVFDVPEEPLAKEFSDFMWDLADLDKLTEKQGAAALRRFRDFAKAFGIDFSRPFDWEELVGLDGWVILGIQKDEKYGEQNTVSKYL